MPPPTLVCIAIFWNWTGQTTENRLQKWNRKLSTNHESLVTSSTELNINDCWLKKSRFSLLLIHFQFSHISLLTQYLLLDYEFEIFLINMISWVVKCKEQYRVHDLVEKDRFLHSYMLLTITMKWDWSILTDADGDHPTYIKEWISRSPGLNNIITW
jgi:hypothetical protein